MKEKGYLEQELKIKETSYREREPKMIETIYRERELKNERDKLLRAETQN